MNYSYLLKGIKMIKKDIKIEEVINLLLKKLK
jgi:hypothetical protein